MNVVYDFSDSILDSYWNDVLQGTTRFAFFNTAQPNTFYQLLERFQARHQDKPVTLIHYQLNRERIAHAYSPILCYLKQLFNPNHEKYVAWQQDERIPRLIREQLHQHLSEQTLAAESELFLNELLYLKQLFHQQILCLLQIFMGDTPTVFNISNVHLASPTLQGFIHDLIQFESQLTCLFCFSLNRRYVFQTHEQNEHWGQFLLDVETQYSLINLSSVSTDIQVTPPLEAPYIDLKAAPTLLLQMAYQQHILFAFIESIAVLEAILEDSFDLSEQQINQAELLLAKNHYFLNNNQQSIAHLERLKERAQKQNAQDILAKTYTLLSLVYKANFDIDSAMSNAFKGLNHAKNTNNSSLLIESLFTFEQSQSTPISDQNWEQLVDGLASDPRWEHHRAYALKNSYTYHDYYEKKHDYHATLQIYLNNCQIAIDYFSRAGLKPSLAEAHHDSAIIYSLMDKFDNAVVHLNTSKAISESLNDTVNIVKVTNGMGYLYFLREQFTQAYELFVQAFQRLFGIKDYREICSTLFNLGFVCCHSRQYKLSLQFFDAIQKLMSILNFTHIPYHTGHEINIMRAFCLIKLGEATKAMEIMNNLPALEEHKNSQTAFFYVLVSALIADSHRNHIHAMQYFQLAKKQLKLNIKSDVCLLPLYYLEYARTLKRMNGDYLVEIDKGIKEAEKLNYPIYAKWLADLKIRETELNASIDLPDTITNLDTLLEFAKNTQKINNLQHNINKIKFLHQLQNLLFKEQNKEKISTKALVLLQTFFPVEFGAIYLFQDSEWQTCCCKLPIDCDPKQVFLDIRLLIYTKQLWIQRYSDEDEQKSYLAEHVKYIVNIPLLFNGNIIGSIFLASAEADCTISNNDIDTLSIAAQQITETFNRIDKAIELKIKNEKLEKTMQELKLTQRELVEAEKMASLGQLVAGVAHEINTPLGVAITATTFSINEEHKLNKSLQENQLSRQQLVEFLEELSKTNLMIFNNLQTASKLVKEFKQVAVDQNNEEKRNFRLGQYLSEIIGSLTPQIKQHKVKVQCTGEQELLLRNYPGIFYQIISNFVMNSIYHGFTEEQDEKLVTIEFYRAKDKDNYGVLRYCDNGKGIDAETAIKVFDPFFTTRRNKGGTGLGLHIVFNLVVQKMRGTIQCVPHLGMGAEFIVQFPLEI